MRRKVIHDLRPFDPRTSETESFRLSILDVVVPPNYNTYAIIFKQDETKQPWIIKTFTRAIEATLRQCRHLAGTIQKNEHGDYSIVVDPENTVQLVIHWMNESDHDFPSYDELEKGNFTLASLGDHHLLRVDEIPESSHPRHNPDVVAFQLNFIRGGFILTVHMHHFAMDMTGTASVVRQIAENCYAFKHGTPAPAWDDSLMDRSRFIAPDIAVEDQVDAPPKPPRHPDWLTCSWLLFHLQPHKAVELKKLASIGCDTKISTYDAVAALLWRVIVRNRIKIYDADINAPAIFGEPINMRDRCVPKISSRYQGNVLGAGLSMTQEKPLTLADAISEARLPELAKFIRTITDSVGQHTIDDTIARIAPVREKTDLDFPLDALSPLSFSTTDWRSARLCDFDFGVGTPMAYRCLYNEVVGNMMVLYPPHKGNNASAEGIEVMIPFETHALDMLKADPDIKRFFEFRGVEATGSNLFKFDD